MKIQGRECLLDDVIYEEVEFYSWHITPYGYAARTSGPRQTTYLHRLVWEYFNGPIPKDKVVDHIDNEARLDNRLSNLRLVNKSTNARNTNKTKGYFWSNYHKAWNARISIDGKTKSRYFKTEREAREWYKEAKLASLQDV